MGNPENLHQVEDEVVEVRRQPGFGAGSQITGKSATWRKFSSTLTSLTKIGPAFKPLLDNASIQ